ncbi:hypothetical protein FDP41_012143 [Naegleria fowleri]|uniref:EF-hand domain-containing protein n=1 Tax=Naegleria fowleri TaxID=5763 RepID=A0A6A5C1F0_NAEFO|nr:uncharacterized protein FDP41_012143 [Naegleria fowleri]KAF0981486.1 hypothetical protein FDP41_012143 [Naegleria fowleri]CAG4709957.1 unnamed protein product [Naegleria fowleri]
MKKTRTSAPIDQKQAMAVVNQQFESMFPTQSSTITTTTAEKTTTTTTGANGSANAKNKENTTDLNAPSNKSSSKKPSTRELSSPEKKRLQLHYPKYKRATFTHNELRNAEEHSRSENPTPVNPVPIKTEKDVVEEELSDDDDGEQKQENMPIGQDLPESMLISKKEVEEAFRFLDVRQKRKLTPKDLKARLKMFYPNMTNKEYKFLIYEPEFTIQTLQNILNIDTKSSIYGSNFYKSYDPVKEAFKVFDPKDTGFVDEKHLKEMMEQLGLGPITTEDLKVLIETADKDGDGKISLEDFRSMTKISDE